MVKKDINKLKVLIKERNNTPVIVEGKRDVAALKKIGFKKIIVLYKKPLYVIVEKIAEKYKEVMILTDFDKEGKKLYGYLYKHLIKRGVRVDNSIRHFLLRNTKLSHIEGLDSYIENNTE